MKKCHSNSVLYSWVQNQRQAYRAKQGGMPSSLTDEKIRQLEEIGFVWNKWEHEFAKACMDLDEPWRQ